MKTKLLIGLLITGIVLISGCVQEGCKVKGDCLDRTCFTKDCIDYNCSYSPIIPCCGNGECELGEDYENCTDCPDCDDKNNCTEDLFDYDKQRCVNGEIVPCCGNGECEPGETYKECADDCADLAPTMISDTNRTGVITSDEVWSGTIHVTGDIQVGEGVTLTILPGTVIEVAAMSDDQHGGVDDYTPNPWFPKDPARIGTQSTKIFIGGILNATGTPDNMIIFTSDSETPTTYDWDGLGISHGRLEYAVVEYSRYNNFQESSDVIVANSTFRHMLECCICIGHSEAISPQILYNDIYNCGHEGIDYAGGSALIKGNYFHLGDRSLQPDPYRGGVGIVVYQNAYPVIEQNVFEDYSVGVYFNKDFLNEAEEGKKAILRNNTMENNRINIDIDPGYPIEAIVMENS